MTRSRSGAVETEVAPRWSNVGHRGTLAEEVQVWEVRLAAGHQSEPTWRSRANPSDRPKHAEQHRTIAPPLETER